MVRVAGKPSQPRTLQAGRWPWWLIELVREDRPLPRPGDHGRSRVPPVPFIERAVVVATTAGSCVIGRRSTEGQATKDPPMSRSFSESAAADALFVYPRKPAVKAVLPAWVIA